MMFSENCIEWMLCYYGCLFHNLVGIPVSYQSSTDYISEILKITTTNAIITSLLHVSKILSIIDMKNTDIQLIIILCTKQEFNNNFPLLQISFPWLMKCDSILFYSYEEMIEIGKNEDIFYNFPPVVYPFIPKSKNSSSYFNGSLSEYINQPEGEGMLFELSFTSGSTGKPKGAMTDEKICLTLLCTMMDSINPIIELLIAPFSFGTGRDIFTKSICNGGCISIFRGDFHEISKDLQIIQPTRIHGVPSFWNNLYGEYKSLLSKGIPKNELDKEFSKFLGNRIKHIITGGSMPSPHVIDFLHKTFTLCKIYNAYGSTEAGGITTNGYIHSGVNWKLIDVPEMDYYSTDIPNPRGELIIKTKELITGYYKDKENNSKNFTSDGWYKTGDIVEKLQSGEIKIIDRKSNIIKLSNGEFVSPTNLENIYIRSHYVNQIYIHVSPTESSIIAIIEASEYLKNKDKDRKTCSHFLLNKLRNLGLSNQLRTHELPCGVYILKNNEKFTVENGCLTSSGKICRFGCAKKFSDKIVKLYQNANNINDINHFLKSNSQSNEIKQLISDTLGYNINDNQSFQLDSLSAVQIMTKFKSKYSISLPVEKLLKVQSIDEILRLQQQKSLNLDVKNNNDELFFNDIKNLRNLNAKKPISTNLDFKSIHEHDNILITGSTGIVGIFLLLKLIQFTKCKIFCLIRCSSIENGKERLLCSLHKFQPISGHSFSLDFNRIVIIPGDLTNDFFGISNDYYDEISMMISSVIHCGAFVHWISGYEGKMRETNVMGTKRIIDFCFYKKLKQIIHISTCNVSNLNRIPVNSSGYTQSKWLSEFLVHQVSSEIPVITFRLGAISGSLEGGVCNKDDFITRIICGIVELKMIPEFDLGLEFLPVDFIAEKIIQEIIKDQQASGGLYTLSNPDSLPLSFVVNCMKKMDGIEIRTVEFEKFIETLENSTSCSLFPLLPFIRSQSFWICNRISKKSK